MCEFEICVWLIFFQQLSKHIFWHVVVEKFWHTEGSVDRKSQWTAALENCVCVIIASSWQPIFLDLASTADIPPIYFGGSIHRLELQILLLLSPTPVHHSPIATSSDASLNIHKESSIQQKVATSPWSLSSNGAGFGQTNRFCSAYEEHSHCPCLVFVVQDRFYNSGTHCFRIH